MTEPSLPLPDLQIFVRRVSKEDPRGLSFEVRARDPELDLNFRDFGSIQIAMSPEQHVRELVQDISSLPLTTDEDRKIARQKIESKGGTLFESLLPEKLRHLLWSLQTKITTLQIVSDDPHIPWELMRLRIREGRRTSEGPFLSEAFAITRWLRGAGDSLVLPVRRLAIVIPKTSGLSAAGGEREDLLALQGMEREVTEIPAKYLEVMNALAEGGFDAWHFGGHGTTYSEDPNLWSLELDNQPLRPEDMGSPASNLGTNRPLIFFNGCHTGRSGWTLAGLGGWPQALLAAGAGAFVGSLWALKDRKARTFAQAFYELFLGGEAIGEAARCARLRVRDEFPGDPAWLAYTIYGNPNARVSFGSEGTIAPDVPLEVTERLIEPRPTEADNSSITDNSTTRGMRDSGASMARLDNQVDGIELHDQEPNLKGRWIGRWENFVDKDRKGEEMIEVERQENGEIEGHYFDPKTFDITIRFKGQLRYGHLLVRYWAPKGQKIMQDGSCFLKLKDNGDWEGYYADFSGCGRYELILDQRR